jgi:hypothetical protein
MILRRPTVVEPITGSKPPWAAPSVDLDAHGYVCEEFAIGGTACAFATVEGTEATPDGRWEVEPDGAEAYRTRLLVVRPADPARFSGMVVLNWQNVSAGYEASTHRGDEVYRAGHAWVGVSAQEFGVHGTHIGAFGSPGQGLVDIDRERYGDLRHPGDQGSFDIFTQAARTVGRDRSGDVDPMGGLEVRWLVATGGSQSAMRLAAYLNGVHPLEQAVDAFLLAVWEGRAPRVEEGPTPFGVKTMIRTDLETPVVVVNSEFEANACLPLPIGDTEWLRYWEVTGTPHGPGRGTLPDSQGFVANTLSYQPVHEMGMRHLHALLRDGRPVPSQPRIEADRPNQQLVRDELGNALGGIRLPELAAPTRAYRGHGHVHGSAKPFDEATLRSLYRDRADYEARWCAAVDHLVATEAVRPEDSDGMKARVTEVKLPFG